MAVWMEKRDGKDDLKLESKIALARQLSWLGPHLDTPRLWVRTQSGHMLESVNEFMNGWSNRWMILFLSHSLSLPPLLLLSLKFFFNFLKADVLIRETKKLFLMTKNLKLMIQIEMLLTCSYQHRQIEWIESSNTIHHSWAFWSQDPFSLYGLHLSTFGILEIKNWETLKTLTHLQIMPIIC